VTSPWLCRDASLPIL